MSEPRTLVDLLLHTKIVKTAVKTNILIETLMENKMY